MSSERLQISTAEHFQGLIEDGVCSDLAELRPLPGDFYAERDDVMRGLTLDLGDDFNFQQRYDAYDPDKMHPQTSSRSCKDFDEGYVPPQLSDEIRSFLGHTALQLLDYSPVAAGNLLLAFLRKDPDTQIDKVNQKKFTLRAVVLSDGLWFKVKVRIYKNEVGSLVEFQRCSGDTLAFHSFYRQLSQYFLQPSSQSSIGRALQIPCMAALPADQAVVPFLDMADSCQNVVLLAEAASVLCVMSVDPAVAAELRMPWAFNVLQQLSQVDDFRVALPTSRMLACM